MDGPIRQGIEDAPAGSQEHFGESGRVLLGHPGKATDVGEQQALEHPPWTRIRRFAAARRSHCGAAGLRWRVAAQRRNVDVLDPPALPEPVARGRLRAADCFRRAAFEHGEHQRMRRQFHRAQVRHPLDQVRRVLEQHVVAQEAFLGRQDHARRAGEGAFEARDPCVARKAHAGPDELRRRERQHDLRLHARILHRLEKQDVGAARGLRVADRRPERRDCFPQRRRHARLDVPRGIAATRRSGWSIMCPENAITCGAGSILASATGGMGPDQQQLPPHRRDVAEAVARQPIRLGVVNAGFVDPIEDEQRFARGRVMPVVAAGAPVPRAPAARAGRARRVACEHRHRGGVDGGVGAAAQRMGVARSLRWPCARNPARPRSSGRWMRRSDPWRSGRPGSTPRRPADCCRAHRGRFPPAAFSASPIAPMRADASAAR